MAITLIEMLRQMQTGAIFSCVVVSYDKKRKTGGKIIEYHQARLFDPQMEQTATRAATEMEQLRAQLRDGKRPNHGKHFTRNIQLMQDGHSTSEVRKIHPPLVDSFNGQTVI